MSIKPSIIHLIYLLLIISSPSNVSLDTIECQYTRQGFKMYDTSLEDYKRITGYGCDIKNIAPNGLDHQIDIQGSHVAGKSDNDVTFVSFFVDDTFINLRKFGSKFCEKFRNLQVVQIVRGQIREVEVDSLKNCRNLRYLDFWENEIREISENLLTGNLKLAQLSLQENEIRNFPENLLANQRDLEELWLGSNKLKTLPPKLLKSVTKLKYLDMESNEFETINPNLFENLQNLDTLNLASNKISELPQNTFNSLLNLKSLHLNDNKIRSINPGWFFNLKNLETLDINDNQIAEVQKYDLRSLTNLESLDIGGNGIKSLDSDLFENFHNLKYLGLAENEILDLPTEIFSSLANLEELYLHDNQLTIIHSDSFGILRHLTNITLQDNSIEAFDEKIIDNTAVYEINMNNNECSDELIEKRNKMRAKLADCFANYEPRGEESETSRSELENCGISMTGTGNIIGGSFISRGAFPWIVALVTSKGHFFCGGTLVANEKVVTAAHCIQEKGGNPKLPRDITVLLGVHDLDRSNEVGRISAAVQTIVIHPDWNPSSKSFDADIAVLMLENDTTMSKFIKTICLLEPDSDVVAKATGVVVGYGQSEDESKLHENIPKILDIPIHNNEKCFIDNPYLVPISSKRTFCGGNANGSGVCKGDSGSGVFVNDGTSYCLRGIVSASLYTVIYECDEYTYAVFTDVAKYYDWIHEVGSVTVFYDARHQE